MIVGAALFCLLLLGLFTWLLHKGKIGQRVFCTLTIGSLFAGIVVARLPDISEVKIAGNTLTLLQRKIDRAEEILSKLAKLESNVLSMEFKRIANLPVHPAFGPPDRVKTEEFDQLMDMLEYLPGKGEREERLIADVENACIRILSRQQWVVGTNFVYMKNRNPIGPGPKFSRSDWWPSSENFRVLTPNEMDAELNELHQELRSDPERVLENDENREFRIEAIENFKKLYNSCYPNADNESL